MLIIFLLTPQDRFYLLVNLYRGVDQTVAKVPPDTRGTSVCIAVVKEAAWTGLLSRRRQAIQLTQLLSVLCNYNSSLNTIISRINYKDVSPAHLDVT